MHGPASIDLGTHHYTLYVQLGVLHLYAHIICNVFVLPVIRTRVCLYCGVLCNSAHFHPGTLN